MSAFAGLVVALIAIGPVLILCVRHPAVKPRPPRPPKLFTRITFCPVCYRIPPEGGCAHSAAETLRTLRYRLDGASW